MIRIRRPPQTVPTAAGSSLLLSLFPLSSTSPQWTETRRRGQTLSLRAVMILGHPCSCRITEPKIYQTFSSHGSGLGIGNLWMVKPRSSSKYFYSGRSSGLWVLCCPIQVLTTPDPHLKPVAPDSCYGSAVLPVRWSH